MSEVRSTRFRDRMMTYLELTKPRLMWLLCLLALAGMGLAVATGAELDGVTVVATLGGGVLAIGASGTFNHVYERDRDRKMRRTADRPIATDRVGVRRATGGVALARHRLNGGAGGVCERSHGRTHGGGDRLLRVRLHGPAEADDPLEHCDRGRLRALPALIGYAAVTGTVGLPAVLLALVVCCWTPAHFYNLAIAHREDYARAEYPMLPVVAGVRTTPARILAWLGITLIAAALLGPATDLGILYALTTTILGRCSFVA